MSFWRNMKQVQVISPNSFHDALSLSTETPCSPLNCLPTLSPPLPDVLDVQSHSCVTEKHTDRDSEFRQLCVVLLSLRWNDATKVSSLNHCFWFFRWLDDKYSFLEILSSCTKVGGFICHVHLSSIWVELLWDSWEHEQVTGDETWGGKGVNISW